jgi:group II intron reverse transcriptase/maturase
MIEQVLHPYNLQGALRQVIANKGSAGVDGLKTIELEDNFRQQKAQLLLDIKECNYLPQAILGVEIPKSNGKTRLLGIPTVTDRLLQQAVSQALMGKYEQDFSPNSYGFRPNKNARQAVGKAREYIHEGFTYIIDIDLKNFFDEVDHCLLLNLLYQKVKCPITLRLIRKWLRVPILINGKLVKRRKGVPQGSPLSPLLSNILLNELDKELTKWNLKFVRYADDFSIYTKTKIDARRTGNFIYTYLKTKLKLTINRDKSGIKRPVQFELLGFGFVSTFKKGEKGKYQLVATKKALERLKMNLKSITKKTKPIKLEERISKINEIQRGWLNYFRGTSLVGKLRDLDGWLRNRLRYCIWHDWKKPDRRRKNFIRLGIDQDHAYAWSRTRMGGWAVTQSPMMKTTITIARLKRKGYQSMLDVYFELNPSFCEPPYTRPVRTVV